MALDVDGDAEQGRWHPDQRACMLAMTPFTRSKGLLGRASSSLAKRCCFGPPARSICSSCVLRSTSSSAITISSSSRWFGPAALADGGAERGERGDRASGRRGPQLSNPATALCSIRSTREFDRAIARIARGGVSRRNRARRDRPHRRRRPFSGCGHVGLPRRPVTCRAASPGLRGACRAVADGTIHELRIKTKGSCMTYSDKIKDVIDGLGCDALHERHAAIGDVRQLGPRTPGASSRRRLGDYSRRPC